MELTVNFTKIYKNTKRVLIEPKKFFSAKKDYDWKDTLTYFITLSVISVVLNYVYLMLIYPLLHTYVPNIFGDVISDISFWGLLPFAVFSFFLGIFFSFFWGFALMAWLKLFKIKTDFAKAYHAITYARTPSYLFSWIPFLNLAAWIYGLYLLSIAIKNYYSVKTKKAAIIVGSGVAAVFVASSLLFLLT